jgi:hypothetical protein
MTAWRSTPGSAQERCARSALVITASTARLAHLPRPRRSLGGWHRLRCRRLARRAQGAPNGRCGNWYPGNPGLLLFILTCCVFGPALAQQTVPMVVKRTYSDGIVDYSGNKYWVWDPNCSLPSFTPAPAVTISPNSGDPNVRTSDPTFHNTCPLAYLPDGQGYWQFFVNFKSLRDLGVWTFKCNPTYVDPNYCVSSTDPPCNITCYRIFQGNPVTLSYRAFNDAPTASVTTRMNGSPIRVLQLDATANDPDGGPVTYQWRVDQRPSASSAQLANSQSASATMTFSSENDIGTWQFKLDVDDDEGERVTFGVPAVTVPNLKPEIRVVGASSVRALQPIRLAVDPRVDQDGGGDFQVVWDLLQSPPRATEQPRSAFRTGTTITLPTAGIDIGTWRFRATATDNEGDSGSAESVPIEVENIPPRINLVGAPKIIRAGSTIKVSTSVVDDEDGGSLTFQWDAVQAPQSAGLPIPRTLQSGAGATGASLSFPTDGSSTGSWIIRLLATDDEGESAKEEFEVVVDAPPEAVIAGPTTIDAGSFPLVLNGESSKDPDSPCPAQPDRCHNTDGRAPSASTAQGITDYTWYVTDIPVEQWGPFSIGRVDEVFGVSATGRMVALDFLHAHGPGRIPPGQWTFQLEVLDAEGNRAYTDHTVVVLPPNTPPTAVLTPPTRYNTTAGGGLLQSVVVSGASSYDLDNMARGAGAGITNYQWGVSPPIGCSAPALPSGGSASAVTLYTTGTSVPSVCQGVWTLRLTVTDDDTPSATGTAETQVIIGNCPQPVCIDSPTAVLPKYLESFQGSNVSIVYHIDSAIYDDPSFLFGMYVRLDILEHGNTTVPVFMSIDPAVLPVSKGGILGFNWNGFTTSGVRPSGSKFDVRVSLLDPNLGTPVFVATESAAIRIETVDVAVLPSSSSYVFPGGMVQAQFEYRVSGALGIGEIRWRVRNSAGSVVTENAGQSNATGVIEWDGIVSGVAVPPGNYTVEVEAYRSGKSLGVSQRHAFVVLRSDIDVDTDRDGLVSDTADDIGEDNWIKSRGAIFSVNHDRDGSRVNGSLPIPDAVHFDDSGSPMHEERAIDNAADVSDITPLVIRGLGGDLPPSLTVVLKVAEKEDIQSIHVFKRIAAGEMAIWGSLGDRVGGASEPLERDITQWVNPASGTFLGTSPADDLVFGLEGLFFRSLGAINPFDGEIDMELEVRDGATVVAGDSVRLKVAPWIILPHTQSSTAIWAEDAGSINDEFRLNAVADSGYFGLDASGQLDPALPTGAEAGTQWFQDHVEVGYVQRPGAAPQHSTFRLPYFRPGGQPQPPWSLTRLLGAEHGAFQIGVDFGADSGDYGGNLEAMPPQAAFPLGRMVFGDLMSAALRQFLTDQEVQLPFDVPTAWLAVGHVDEALAFTTLASEAIIASPSRAWALMNSVPAAQRAARVFFTRGGATEVHTVVGSTPNRITVAGVDFTGTTWDYLRIFSDAGSGAAGQVAHVSNRGVGFLEIDVVWATPVKLVPPPPPAVFPGDTVLDHLDPGGPCATAPSNPSWLTPPGAGDRFVLVEGDPRRWCTGLPAIITVEEVLADTDLETLNTVTIAAELATIRGNLDAARGAPFTYREVPAIYLGRPGPTFSIARSAGALVPGAANVQYIAGVPYFPRQFAFPNAIGGDAFEAAIRSLFPSARFVDDWDLYHRWLGEIHCGTTAVRTTFALDWWDSQP